MDKTSLFSNIIPKEKEAMCFCMNAQQNTYRTDEMIMDYSENLQKVGIILKGRAILYYCDLEGNEYIIEELPCDSVFGEPFLLPIGSQHYYVIAVEETVAMFIGYQHIIKRCAKACSYHSQLISNLFQMSAQKSRNQANRIYILSRSSTREKILAYFDILSQQKQSREFQLPMNYTKLAEYLCADRSSMMREMKKLTNENIIGRSGHFIRLL